MVKSEKKREEKIEKERETNNNNEKKKSKYEKKQNSDIKKGWGTNNPEKAIKEAITEEMRKSAIVGA